MDVGLNSYQIVRKDISSEGHTAILSWDILLVLDAEPVSKDDRYNPV